MFAWRYDEQTGGVFIDPEQTAPPVAMREPRPVYAKELRMRGFDRALDLPEDDAVVAWDELSRPYYRGAMIGKFKSHPRQPIAPRRYEVIYKGNSFEFVVDANQDRVLVCVPKAKYYRAICALLRRLFSRASFCVGCGHCAAQCSRAALSIDKSGTVELSGDCAHCLQCIQDDCKRAHSLNKTGKEQRIKDLKQYGLDEWAKVQRS